MAVVCRLREFRKANGVGFTELMRASGVASSTLSRMEQNKTTSADYATLDRLIAYFRSRGLQCGVGDLLVYVEEDSVPPSTLRT